MEKDRTNGSTSPNVVCVTLAPFPFGGASSSRIHLIGKSLVQTGAKFRVLTCGTDRYGANKKVSGNYDGIPFEYTAGTFRRSNWRIVRKALLLWGALKIIPRLFQLRYASPELCVYLYAKLPFLVLIVGLCCHVLRIPVVQEVCEWWEASPGSQQLARWLHNGPMFRLCTAAIVISRTIADRVLQISLRLGHKVFIQQVPVLVDVKAWASPHSGKRQQARKRPCLLWCGSMEAYMRDVLFIIRSLSLISPKHFRCQLVLVGRCTESTRTRVANYAVSHGISEEDIVMTGYVPQNELRDLYHGASALLAPLWDDDRSCTRMPTKIGEYLTCGSPVITCDVGEVGSLLKEGDSAFIAKPGDCDQFARKIREVLADPVRASSVGLAGKYIAENRLHYEKHIASIRKLFDSCQRDRRKSSA